MKRIFTLMLIIQAIALIAETTVGEGKFIKTVSNEESLFIYRNSNFFDREVIYPEKNNSFKYKILKEDTVLTLTTPADSLIEIYSVKRKNDKPKYLYYADNYGFFKIMAKAGENYKKAFEFDKKDYSAYGRMIDFYSENIPDSLDGIMEKYLNENPDNLGVLFKNSKVKRAMNMEYKDLIERALPLKEASSDYFDVILTALYEVNGLNDTLLKSALDYAVENFYAYDDFIFIMYYIMDNYNSLMFDTIMAGRLSYDLSQPVNDEVKFYISTYFIDNKYMENEALSNMKGLIGSEIYPDYGEYILYSIAKVHLSMNEGDSAYAYITKASEEFNPQSYDFQKMKFEIAVLKNDTVNAIDSGVRILTYDRNDKDVFGKVVALSKSNAKTVNKKIDEYLDEESENRVFEDYTLTSLNDKESKFSKYKNKVVLIDFFATWCGPCKMEIKDLVLMKKEYSKEKKIAFVAVSSEDDAELIKEFAKNMSFDFDIYYNGGPLMNRESIKGVPTIYLIDKKGRVCYSRVGYSEENDKYIKTRIDYLLKK
jgi:thiol-disulfide isomerase/thioredoxin